MNDSYRTRLNAFDHSAAALKRPLLITHERPDGDAWGCLIAVNRALAASGADPLPVAFDPPTSKYAWLVTPEPIRLLTRSDNTTDSAPQHPHAQASVAQDAAPTDPSKLRPTTQHAPINESQLESADGIILLDTCSTAQVQPLAPWIDSARSRGLPVRALDHHVTRNIPTDTLLVDESAAAACLIVFEWLRSTNRPIDPTTATALFTGIATDTGCFAHPNTDARLLAAASELATLGTAPHRIHDRLFLSEPACRVRLFAAAMDRMKLYHDDRIAVLIVSPDLLNRTGAQASDTEDLAGQPLRITTVELSVLIVETGGDPPTLKLSFRSKTGADVARVAARFGGGGHTKAAGARLQDRLDSALPKIIDALTRALDEASRR